MTEVRHRDKIANLKNVKHSKRGSETPHR